MLLDVIKMSDKYKIGNGFIEHEREKALLVCVEGESMWIPKSVIHDDSEVYPAVHDRDGMLLDRGGKDGDVVVKRWWAEKNDLVSE